MKSWTQGWTTKIISLVPHEEPGSILDDPVLGLAVETVAQFIIHGLLGNLYQSVKFGSTHRVRFPAEPTLAEWKSGKRKFSGSGKSAHQDSQNRVRFPFIHRLLEGAPVRVV